MVIKLGIGQSAGLLPMSDQVAGYGRLSQTERELVDDEGLASQSLLKIQSGLLRKSEDSHREMR